MTGLEAVFGAGTTRLSAVVHYLQQKHGWNIASVDKAVGCRDGRTAHVSEYSIAPEVISLAMADGADVWCEQVRAARAALRTRASDAAARAKKINAARVWRKRRCIDERQTDMFGVAIPAPSTLAGA